MPSTPSSIRSIIPILLLLASAGGAPAAEFGVSTSSYLGSASDSDAVKGVVIQSDGTVVLAANIGDAQPGAVTPVLLNGAGATTNGCVIRLSADGKTVLSVTRLAASVLDLAVDAADNLYVAAAYAGLIRLNPAADAIQYAVLAGNYIYRVDAGAAGYAACLVPTNVSTADDDAGQGTLYVFDPMGALIGSFAGKSNTQDLAIDEATQSVFTVGWRQASCWGPPGEGCAWNPVQIAYTRAHSFTGTVKWTGYDWSSSTHYNSVTDSYDPAANDCISAVTDPAKINPRFINKYKNNMADTRGYRAVMGRDGYLYFGFESAGGNHIFRDNPFDLSAPGSIVGGDNWHQFTNTGASHKTYVGRYDPATGNVVLGNQFNSLTTSGGAPSANALRIKGGGLAVDELGRIYLAGESAWALPFFPSRYYIANPAREVFNPFGAWGYAGGAHLWVQSQNFANRDYVTRLGFGTSHAVAARVLSGNTTANIAYGGSLTLSSGPAYTQDPVQPQPGYGQLDGFFAVFGGTTGGTGTAHYRFSYGEGAEYAAGAQLRNGPPPNTVVDLDGDGADDSVREYVYSETTPLSPATGYTGPAFFGGFRGNAYNSTNLTWNDYQIAGSKLTVRLQPVAPVATTVHGLIYFPRGSFSGLNAGDKLSFDRNSLVFCDATGADNARWVVRQGGYTYVSEATLASNAYLSFSSDTDDGRWALWTDPAGLDFDAAAATYITRNFDNIDGIGFLVDKGTPSSDRFMLEFSTLWADFALNHTDNQPPAAAFTVTPSTGVWPLAAAVDASGSSDPDGSVSFYAWTFDNDTASAGPAETTSYPAAGPYWPSLKIWDDDLTTATATRTVWVYGNLGGDTAKQAAALGGTMGTADFARYATVNNIDLDGDGADDSTTGSPFSSTSPLGVAAIEGTLLHGGFIAKNYDLQKGADDRGYRGSTVAIRVQSSGVTGTSLHAALYVDKGQFLNRAAHKAVTLDGTSSFKVAGLTRFENLGSLRWLIRDGQQFYVSEAPFTNASGTATLTFASSTDHGRWAPYDPASNDMNFNAAGAVFATRQFTDVTGIGFVIDKDTPTASRIWLEFARLEFVASFSTDNSPPVADFSFNPAKVDILQMVAFDASASTSSGSIVSYKWDFGGGSKATGAVVSHRYTTLGDKTVTLTVTDDLGRAASVSKIYPVVTNNAPVPAIGAVPATGVAPLMVAFDAAASTDDGSIVLYEWDFTSDGAYDAFGVTANHTYSAVGYYTAKLRVTDDGGKTATAMVSISATDASGKIPPVAVLSATPASGNAPLAVSFSGLASNDPNGSITAYAWDLDNDGQFDDGASATLNFTFVSAGSYLVRLQVTDNEGATATASTTITVTVPPGAETIVNWSGDYVTANKKFRNGTPTTENGLDLNADSILSDRRISYPWSTVTPLTPSSGYTGPLFFGGIRFEILNNSSQGTADEGVLNQTTPPDLLSTRWQTQTIGQEGRWHWVLFWDKAGFLNGGDLNPVDLTANSKIEMAGITRFDSLGSARWLIRDGSQFYVSQATLSNTSGKATLTFAADGSDGAWASFDPATNLNFDAAAAVFADRNFSNVTAVGFILDKDTFSAVRHWIAFNRFTLLGRVNAPTLTFATWIADPAFGLGPDERGPDDDPEKDGLSNLLEYALVLNPSQPDGFDAVAVREETGHLYLSYRVRDGAADITVIPVYSDSMDAGSWVEVPSANITETGVGAGFTGYEASMPVGTVPVFLRLEID